MNENGHLRLIQYRYKVRKTDVRRESKIKQHTGREETNRKSRITQRQTEICTDTKETERHPNRQTGSQIERKTKRHTKKDRQTGGKTDIKQKYMQTDRQQTARQIDWGVQQTDTDRYQTDRQVDFKIDRQAGTEADIQQTADSQTDGLED